LYDNTEHHTHFMGFMLEEEIAASLWGFEIIGDTKQKIRSTKLWGRDF
jgi:hypothetical protein